MLVKFYHKNSLLTDLEMKMLLKNAQEVFIKICRFFIGSVLITIKAIEPIRLYYNIEWLNEMIR